MRIAILPALLLTATPAAAEVVKSSDAGFSTTHSIEIAAPPERVWAALLQVGSWWQPSHTYSGKVENLSLDARGGGCWCEKIEGGSVEHMRVVQLDRAKTLRLTGGLGPLQALPVTGVMTFTLESTGSGTRLKVTYDVAGPGLAGFAAPVDAVLGAQWPRLKEAAERGGAASR